MDNFDFSSFESEENEEESSSPVEQHSQILPPTQLFPNFDEYLVQHIEDFDKFVEDIRAFSMRSLTRGEGYLTVTGSDEFVKKFDEIYKGYPNGTRKTKIRKLLTKHPSLQSTNPDVMWRRITHFVKLYGDKETSP